MPHLVEPILGDIDRKMPHKRSKCCVADQSSPFETPINARRFDSCDVVLLRGDPSLSFLWFEGEAVVAGSASWIMAGNAADAITKELK